MIRVLLIHNRYRQPGGEDVCVRAQEKLLRERGHDVRHFALLAERETVLRRLRERGLGHALRVVAGKDAPLRRESFAVSRLDECLGRLREPEFAEHVRTDHLTVPQVADHIAAAAGLTLAPNTDGALRRAWGGARHIRFV